MKHLGIVAKCFECSFGDGQDQIRGDTVGQVGNGTGGVEHHLLHINQLEVDQEIDIEQTIVCCSNKLNCYLHLQWRHGHVSELQMKSDGEERVQFGASFEACGKKGILSKRMSVKILWGMAYAKRVPYGELKSAKLSRRGPKGFRTLLIYGRFDLWQYDHRQQ